MVGTPSDTRIAMVRIHDVQYSQTTGTFGRNRRKIRRKRYEAKTETKVTKTEMKCVCSQAVYGSGLLTRISQVQILSDALRLYGETVSQRTLNP